LPAVGFASLKQTKDEPGPRLVFRSEDVSIGPCRCASSAALAIPSRKVSSDNDVSCGASGVGNAVSVHIEEQPDRSKNRRGTKRIGTPRVDSRAYTRTNAVRQRWLRQDPIIVNVAP